MLHLEDAQSAVIVEGVCDEIFPGGQLARRLSELSKSKYGYGPDPASYAKNGIWRLRAERVLAWERFPRDATRFVFGPAPDCNYWRGASALGSQRPPRANLPHRSCF